MSGDMVLAPGFVGLQNPGAIAKTAKGFVLFSGLQPLHGANDLIGDRFLNPVLHMRCKAYA